MSLTSFLASSIAAACRDNASAVAESLNLCFDRNGGTVSPGDPVPWNSPPDGLGGPGLIVRIGTTEGGLVALIPATLPLPEWYASPNESQKSRLRTLAAEWGIVLLPEDVMADVTEADAVPDLATAAAECVPDTSAESIAVSIEGGGTIHLLTPVTRIAASLTRLASLSQGPPVDRPIVTELPLPVSPPSPPPAPVNPAFQRLNRLRNLPVQVVVHLAEKKIEMGQLLSLSPGALITFGKNCEDLLDLYVNNRLYCRGEAVKIGEHFGLKINEVGAVKRREERVF